MKLIKRRNEIVHRTQVEPIETSIANEVVSTGMAVIQHCMECLLTREESRSGKSGA